MASQFDMVPLRADSEGRYMLTVYSKPFYWELVLSLDEAESLMRAVVKCVCPEDEPAF